MSHLFCLRWRRITVHQLLIFAMKINYQTNLPGVVMRDRPISCATQIYVCVLCSLTQQRSLWQVTAEKDHLREYHGGLTLGFTPMMPCEYFNTWTQTRPKRHWVDDLMFFLIPYENVSLVGWWTIVRLPPRDVFVPCVVHSHHVWSSRPANNSASSFSECYGILSTRYRQRATTIRERNEQRRNQVHCARFYRNIDATAEWLPWYTQYCYCCTPCSYCLRLAAIKLNTS